ncbi:glycoside hydrolase family 18 protein [Streptomyces sp. DSM 42041]|uniref:chitinase n=1 Tax=Streptomyces hazeniae TaxID=3075538 RepID=A0ABU2NVJ1_9ACTN|nr:glycoside hydrolase family 18 protein [Streptomyces sp. DSM 42041]MDT0380996.1 glycoside hydrolase family 18 protein [Streptomyces sp. DSM 42041]
MERTTRTSRRHRGRRPSRGLTAGAAALAAAGALIATALTGPAAGAAPAEDDGSRAAAQLLDNAGFEAGLEGWTCSGDSGAAAASPARSGARALTATPAGQDNARCSQVVAVEPDADYTLSGWVQGSYVYLGATGTGTTDVATWTGSTPSWKQLSTTFRTGPDTTSVTVYLHGWYGQGAYHADDLALSGPGEPGDPGDPGDPEVPAVPSGLTVGAVTAGSVDLSWSEVPDATAYHVYRDGTKVASVEGASATVAGLSPSTSYAFRVSAVNGVGESAKSAAVTARTSADGGDGGTTVPEHALTGYVQNFDNGAQTQRLTEVQDAYDIIAVAFASSTSTPGELTFALDPALAPSDDAFKADIAAKQAEGKAVILSVGGELGNVTVNDDASARAFADSAWALMQEYGFDGIDIDLEHGINSTYLTQAIRDLAANAGPDFVLTMAPQTLDMQSTSTEYFTLALNVKDILTVVNMQYYNSGSMLGCDGQVYSQGSVDFLTALACIQLRGGLDASQVGLGTPASPRGAGSGHVDPSVVNDALDCLARGTHCGSFQPSQTYPSLRGAMTWSTNWDALNGDQWSNAVGPHVHGLP